MKNLTLLLLLLSHFAFSQENKFRSEEVDYWNTTDSVHIFGTLTMPEKGSKFPAVLLITGSGPEDRDETIFGHKPFKVIAEYLSNRGLAVLRVDDRGVGKTTKGKNPKLVTSENFAKDVLSGVEFLKNRKEINASKIGLIGHSEGGMIAPMVANQSKDVAFIVSLAGTGVSGRVVLLNQAEAMLLASKIDTSIIKERVNFNSKLFDLAINENDSKIFEEKLNLELNGLSDEQKNKLGFKGMEKMVIAQAKSLNIPWTKFFLKYDPAQDWLKVKVPVLALNGMKDTQVTYDLNLSAIEKALKNGGNKHYKIIKLEGLNHLFQHAETGLYTEYATIKEDFAPEALQIMGDWLTEITK
jgi:uncharacterized protein